MKQILKKIPLVSKIAILIAILIVIATQTFTSKYTLQYIEDGELQTESFKTKEGFNNKVIELQADNIKYWLDLN